MTHSAGRILLAALLALPGPTLLAGCEADDGRPAERPGEAAPALDAARADSAPVPDATAVTDSARTAGAAADSAAEAGSAESIPDGWEGAEVAVSGEGHGVLTAVRTGRHGGHDRMVFEFEGELPGYTVRYPSEPLRQCGSGQPILVDEPHALQIVLRSAAAHDDAGQATVQDRRRAPALPVLRTARLTCDYEGEVEWVLGVDRRAGFRVFALDGPARLVVDLRH